MGTISQTKNKTGYCPIDKQIVAIPIPYYSSPRDGDTKKSMTFFKAQYNECRYISEGKCDKKTDCPIWQSAESPIKIDVSNLKF